MSIEREDSRPGSLPDVHVGQWLARRFDERPYRFFLWVLAGQLVLWTAMPMLVFHSLPLDMVENVGWGREWQLGYYKHPPLQAWVVGAALMLGGNTIQPLFALGPLAIALTMLPLYLLGREAAGERAGLLAVLFFSLTYYASLASIEFNANIVQMPVWAWAGFALWRATQRGGLWWPFLGALLALALYAKYSAVILVATLVVAGLSIAAGRSSLRRPGPYVATVVALALAAPHFYWLTEADWMPLAYVSINGVKLPPGELLLRIVGFVRTQALDLAAGLAVLAIGGGLWLGRRAEDGVELSSGHEVRRFVVILAFAPIALSSLVSLVRGIGLHDMWGAPMIVWIGLALVLLARPAYVRRRLPAMLSVWLALFVAAPLVMGLVAAAGPSLGMKPLRTGWPAASLAGELTTVWRAETAAPLRIVAGGTWESGILSAYSPDRPSVMAEGALRFNPWIDEKRLADEGVLVVWDMADFPTMPEGYRKLGPFTATGEVSAPFPGSSRPPARFGYAIRPPHAS